MVNNSLKGKVVFITGASLGIGKETAFAFAREGCKLALTYYKDEKEGKEVLAKCKELGAEDVLFVKLNLMEDLSIKEVVKKVVAKYRYIDILINNAGIVVWKKLAEQSFQEIEQQLRINLEGLIKMTRESLPFIHEMVINLASAAGLEGYEEITTYCATKFGVRGFTKACAAEMSNIKSYSINPGVIATRMNDFQGMPPEKVAEVILNVVRGEYILESGDDVNIWDYVS
ncbi:MAG: SDR family NAD(P)-dependent oxidoreductase [Nanoarchaeota archaeon]|nr:SDR family NAD(P)-dependent oxidoreductase [Nanoarchaeota archaeon]